jgi:ketosteroid isomerase-like protein
MTVVLFLVSAAFFAAVEPSPVSPGSFPLSSSDQEGRIQELQEQVRATEQAFAKTMADQDHEAFVSFLSEETIFFNGSTPIRGKVAVAEAWKAFFDGPQAPFSWGPEGVEVLDSGTLAISFGPVKDPNGNVVATFQSIWRLDDDGKWRIIFDKGCPVAGGVPSQRE